MKIKLILLLLAIAFCAYDCSGDNDFSSDGDECADGNCSQDASNDGDADDEVELEQASESESPVDLCAEVTCPAPDLCQKDVICNPENGKCEIVFSDAGESCSDGTGCNGEETCDGNGICSAGQPVECVENASCTEPDGQCECNMPFMWSDDECIPMNCESDSECNDGLACNGVETCSAEGQCTVGNAVECDSTRQCSEPEGDCICGDDYYESAGNCLLKSPCPVPNAPALSPIHRGAAIEFSAPDGYDIQLCARTDCDTSPPETWSNLTKYILSENGSVTLLARTQSDTCRSAAYFSFIYKVEETYPPAAGQDGSTAIHMSSEVFKGWASGWQDPVNYGAAVIDAWKTPQKALGPATGSTTDIVSLGQGGSIVLIFDVPIKDGPSYDFAVFENGFNDSFLELAFVEVSSDGEHFLRFDCAYLGTEPLGAFAYQDTSLIGGLAGKYRAAYGTPFDLAELANREQVLEGETDLNDIRYIRIIDVTGDGSTFDSFGNPIYAPFPTTESAGFDLEAVGVINN